MSTMECDALTYNPSLGGERRFRKWVGDGGWNEGVNRRTNGGVRKSLAFLAVPQSTCNTEMRILFNKRFWTMEVLISHSRYRGIVN